MPQFAAHLSLMYPKLPLLDRFAAAARDGFRAVELHFPYAVDPREIAVRLQDNGLQLVLFNAPAGGFAPAAVSLQGSPIRDIFYSWARTRCGPIYAESTDHRCFGPWIMKIEGS